MSGYFAKGSLKSHNGRLVARPCVWQHQGYSLISVNKPMRAMCGRTAACVLAAMLVSAGCTTEAWYNSGRSYSEANCRKQPPGAAEECMARLNNMSYDAYERERSTNR